MEWNMYLLPILYTQHIISGIYTFICKIMMMTIIIIIRTVSYSLLYITFGYLVSFSTGLHDVQLQYHLWRIF